MSAIRWLTAFSVANSWASLGIAFLQCNNSIDKILSGAASDVKHTMLAKIGVQTFLKQSIAKNRRIIPGRDCWCRASCSAYKCWSLIDP